MNDDLLEKNSYLGFWRSFDNEYDALKELRKLNAYSFGDKEPFEYRCYRKDGVLNPKTFERKSYCNLVKYSVIDKLKEGKFYIYYLNDIENSQITTPEDYPQYIPVRPLSIELGYSLIPLIEEEYGSELIDRLDKIRNNIVTELGLPAPPVTVSCNFSIEASGYLIKLYGEIVGEGEVIYGKYLVINPDDEKYELSGIHATDPTFKLPAIWIDEEKREFAEREGFSVVDTPTIILTHLNYAIENNAYKLLGRDEVNVILNTLKNEYPVLIKEVESIYKIGVLKNKLKEILRHKGSLRDIVNILEALCDSSIECKYIGKSS